MFANARIHVDVDAFHDPLHVERPFWTLRLREMFGKGMHRILSAGHSASVENHMRPGANGLPIRCRLSKVLCKSTTKALKRFRTDYRATRTCRDRRLIQGEDEKIATLISSCTRGFERLQRNGDAEIDAVQLEHQIQCIVCVRGGGWIDQQS